MARTDKLALTRDDIGANWERPGEGKRRRRLCYWRQLNFHGTGDRLVIWEDSPAGNGGPCLIWFGRNGKLNDFNLWEHRWRGGEPCPVEHTAFVKGTLPGYMYADWLEGESGIQDIPPKVLALLRLASDDPITKQQRLEEELNRMTS